MRRLILALALAAPLAGCGKSDQGDGSAGGSAMTAETIATNDVTAIDAVTGEAANMAADVDLDANLVADDNATGNAAATGERPSRRPSTPARSSTAAPPASQPAPAPEPQANSAE